MRLCNVFQPLVVLVAFLAACPASAQVYKWVDESGVTNYSSKPPTDRKTAKKLELIVVKAAVDTSNAALPTRRMARAAPADVRGDQQHLLDRISNLEREVQAERQARQYESELQANQYAADLEAQQYAVQAPVSPPPAGYDPCLDNSYDGCYGNSYSYGAYYPWPVVAVVPVYHRPRPFIRAIPANRMRGGFRGTAFNPMRNRGISATATSGRIAGRGHWH